MNNILLILGLSISINSFALLGQGREGGTPQIAKVAINKIKINERRQMVREMLNSGSLKKRMIFIVDKIHKADWKYSFGKTAFNADISVSTYKFIDKGQSCFDKDGVARFATTAMNKVGAEVCFDLSKVYENEHLLSFEELLTITFHEHLHHFGIADKDHSEGAWLAREGSHLPNNLGHGGCRFNLTNGQDGFNHRVYKDYLGMDEELELQEFKLRAYEAYQDIFAYSGCDKPKREKVQCQNIFSEQIGVQEDGKPNMIHEHICKIETDEGYMFITEDMLQYMNINFNRWD